MLDDTLCEHVGSLFDNVDRHENHGGGPVRFPVALRLSRRYEAYTR